MRYIAAKIYRDRWFRQLKPPTRQLFLWCLINDHVDIAGYATFTPDFIAFEAMMEQADVEAGLVELSPKVEWWPDLDLVWVRNFTRYQAQGGNFKKSAIKLLNKFIADGDVRLVDVVRVYASEYPDAIDWHPEYVKRNQPLIDAMSMPSDAMSMASDGLESPHASASASVPASVSNKVAVPYDDIRTIWNETAGAAGCVSCRSMTADRKKNIRAIWKECKDLDEWRAVFIAISSDPNNRGLGDTGWRGADLEFATRQKQWARYYDRVGDDGPQSPTDSGRYRDL